jgi:hypothetical protein
MSDYIFKGQEYVFAENAGGILPWEFGQLFLKPGTFAQYQYALFF